MNRFFKGCMIVLLAALNIACQEDDPPAPAAPDLVIQYARLGAESILHGSAVSPHGNIVIGFSKPVSNPTEASFILRREGTVVNTTQTWAPDAQEVKVSNPGSWEEGRSYSLIIGDQIKSEDGGLYSGDTLQFSIRVVALEIVLRDPNGRILDEDRLNTDIDLLPQWELVFSHPVTEQALTSHLEWSGENDSNLSFTALSDSSYTVQPDQELEYYATYEITLSEGLSEATGRPFDQKKYELFTRLDSTLKFPMIPDEELLTRIQQQTFRYFWEGAEPHSGMARERNTSGTTVTTGGTGFGLMAMIVAVERGFISRAEAVERWTRIVHFLSEADRFHGAWPHWINGMTGKVQPFSAKDNGADLVETAFLIQGMLTVRQYLNPENSAEQDLIELINELWHGVEWDWFTRSGENVLYWHWSPEYEWEINLPIRGHNETQIVYILAAASPDHSIEPEIYHEGYTRSGNMKNGNIYFDIELPLGPDKGGPLFFTHYSYLGLDPRRLQDQYANYWDQNTNHTLINHNYCIDNPRNFIGYSAHCWGLTASDGNEGYSAHSPTNDRGVITPTAAISSIPYTPEESLDAIRHFYYLLGDRLWGEYGFYDAFNISEEWVADSYLAIDQGPIVCMIENYRTGLLWDLFMGAPEIQSGLQNLNFSYE